MKKILFMIPNLGYGGAEKVLVNLVNNIDSTQFNVTVQTLFDVGVYKDKVNKNVRYIKGFPFMFRGNSHFMKLFSPRVLYKLLIKEEYDIVVSYLEGPAARIISGCPTNKTKKIAWIHTQMLSESKYIEGFRNRKEADYCYSMFDKIICVSNDIKESMKLYNNFDNYEVLYNTNDTNDILEKSKEEINDVSFNDSLNICSVGKIIEVKGFDRLVKVHKRLMDEGYQHHIYLLGEGDQRNDIESYINKYHLQDTFTLLGFKPNPYKYIVNSDLYVCSSYREGFSTSVTESLVLGTPVLTTLCSGMKELLGDNEYGMIVENSEEGLYKGLKSILDNPSLLKEYKEKAQLRGKEFSKEFTVKAVENMLNQLMEG